MKKIISVLLILALAVSVVACGKKKNAPAENTTVTEPVAESDTIVTEPVAENDNIVPEVEEGTVGAMHWDKFVETVNAKPDASVEEIAADVVSLEINQFMYGTMPIEAGYLSGFDNYEVSGFKSGAMFAPMIGSIAYVGYVFELEDGADVSAFIETLKANSNPRWQICVMADQTVAGAVGNKVFFLMCPMTYDVPTDEGEGDLYFGEDEVGGEIAIPDFTDEAVYEETAVETEAATEVTEVAVTEIALETEAAVTEIAVETVVATTATEIAVEPVAPTTETEIAPETTVVTDGTEVEVVYTSVAYNPDDVVVMTTEDYVEVEVPESTTTVVVETTATEIVTEIATETEAPVTEETVEETVTPAVEIIIPDAGEGTVGAKHWEKFVEVMNEGTTNVEEIAAKVVSLEINQFMYGTMPIEAGFLSGFDNYEVSGFKSGAMFAPMIGSIAYVGYVFELEDGADVSAFIETLKANSNPRWQICVKADQTVAGAYNNTVFFLMCPENYEG